jgi:hypothetical protein
MDAAIQRGKAKSQNQGEQSHHEQHSNTNVATLPSSPKAQTAKDVIAANVKLLIEQLEAGHSEGLTAMGRFHNYSFGNILEIARQRAVTCCYTSLEPMNMRSCALSEASDGA